MVRRAFIILSTLLVLLIPNLAAGQASQPGQGLEISPPLAELKADPGQSLETTIRVRNVTQETLAVKAEVNDFVAGGEDGQPKLLLEEGEASPYSIKSWITTISGVTLASKEQKPITITLRVPADASPGGHYGVVRFTGTPPGLEDTGVSLSASVGALILVNVSGDVHEEAKIVELYTAQNGHKRSFFEYGPISLVERIENSGNVHIKPKGTVRVTNMFGREVASFAFNEQGGNVLPGSIRKFEQTVNKKLLFGWFKLQADVVYGTDNKIISTTHTFWVIPYKLIFILLIALLLVLWIIRRYNRYIVKRAHKKSGRHDGKKAKTRNKTPRR